jgi:hypothetical protein
MTHPLPSYDPQNPGRWDPEPPPQQVLRVVPSDDHVTTQDVQGMAEGVVVYDDSNSIEFEGKRFRLSESIGLMPLLKFSHAAKGGLGADDMEGLDAMYLLIRSCIDRSKVQAADPQTGEPVFDAAGDPVWDGPSQWELFEAHAIETNADGEKLSAMINRAVTVIAARPTGPRGDSSASSARTSPSSKESSSSPVTRPAPQGFEGMTAVRDLGR